MLINEQIKHLEISQKILRWKFNNIKTLSMKPNYISIFKNYIIYFQNHEGASFLKVNIIHDSYYVFEAHFKFIFSSFQHVWDLNILTSSTNDRSINNFLFVCWHVKADVEDLDVDNKLFKDVEITKLMTKCGVWIDAWCIFKIVICKI
jgi:hypothetical protein